MRVYARSRWVSANAAPIVLVDFETEKIAVYQKSFCTTREAADLLGVSLRTAQLWTESGLLTAWKTDGGHRRIDRDSVDRLLANPAERRKVAPPPVQAAQAEAPVPAVSEGFHILVVEDNEDLLKLYRSNIAKWEGDFRVTTINNGFNALMLIGHARPDLVITDLFMPHLDGFQMLQAIRSVPEYKSLPIVAVSGRSYADINAEGGLPADIVLFPKPIPFAKLKVLAKELASARQPAA